MTEEVAFSRRLSAKFGWAMLDVTRRSIEETAAAVMKLLADRQRQRRNDVRMTHVARRAAADPCVAKPCAANAAAQCRDPFEACRPISTSVPFSRSPGLQIPARSPHCWRAKRRSDVSQTARSDVVGADQTLALGRGYSASRPAVRGRRAAARACRPDTRADSAVAVARDGEILFTHVASRA